MSLEETLFSALRGLVSDRVYPSVFEQPDGSLPAWPAIRYTVISSVPVEDLCGDGDDDTADVNVQLDVVAATYNVMLTVRLDVMGAMRTLYPPARLSNSMNVFDVETKTHRAVLEYQISGSSDPFVDSPP